MALFEKGKSGNPNGRPKGKSIARLILDLGQQVEANGKTKMDIIAQKVIDIMQRSDDPKQLIEFSKWISEVTDGKPIAFNVNTEIQESPLNDIPQEHLEKFIKELQANNDKLPRDGTSGK